MDKLDLTSKNIVNENIEKISELFPNCVVESEKGKSIDFDALRQELADVEIAGGAEKYELTWPSKRQAKVTANTPTTNTLRPVKEKSVDFDNTQNIYIEGDNLEALKILQESYLGKIKCIYIDPPYNTGNDFIYKDNFNKDSKEELEESGQVDEEGNRLVKNADSSGRYHSDWLSMMYPRLKLARNLLSDDGVIFISIDDNEQGNLKKICDEIFGENNFIAQINNITGANQSGDGVLIQKNVEYCLCYAKNISKTLINRIDKTEESYRNLNDAPTPLNTRLDMGYTLYYNPSTKDLIPLKDYDKKKVELNTIELVYTDNIDLINRGYVPIRPGFRNGLLHRWRWGIETFLERKDEIVVFGQAGEYVPKFKQAGYNAPKNIQNFSGGSLDLKKLFGEKSVFDYPKGLNFMQYIVDIATSENDIVLDFFSGSATTAHAIIKLNAEKNKKIKYILVQIPEKIENNESHSICDLGEERIKRAVKSIKEETSVDIDYGFRVYKLDSSNMKDVYYKPNDINQVDLIDMASNIKEDRTPEDLLTQVILDLGLTLDLKIEEKKIKNNNVFFVADNALVACFDDEIDMGIIDEICKCKPLKLVFKDSSFRADSDKINLEEKIKKLSPETEIKVL